MACLGHASQVLEVAEHGGKPSLKKRAFDLDDVPNPG